MPYENATPIPGTYHHYVLRFPIKSLHGTNMMLSFHCGGNINFGLEYFQVYPVTAIIIFVVSHFEAGFELFGLMPKLRLKLSAGERPNRSKLRKRTCHRKQATVIIEGPHIRRTFKLAQEWTK